MAFWMGVPVIARYGDRHSARMYASVLHATEHGDCVAPPLEAYQQLAVSLAGDPARLGAMRDGMRERPRHSTLLDASGVTRDLENAPRSAWQHWCRRQVSTPS
jgi:predicted O-linked N-acetylglucosamine transferase (SPINDLY family)